MRKQALICDLDMTLIDSREDIGLAASRALLAVLGRRVPAEQVFGLIGRPLKEVFVRLAPDLDEATLARCIEVYKADFFDHCDLHTRPYEGVVETLEELRRREIRLAVATTKMTFMARHVCEKLGLLGFFDHLQGTDGFPEKPNPEVVRRACAAVGIAPGSAVVIGDTVMDVRAAQGAGASAVAVTYGIGLREELAAASPDALLDSFASILDWFPV